MILLRSPRWTHAFDKYCINCVKVTRIVPSYTCLDQSSPEPAAGRQKHDLDHQRKAHRLNSIINHQHTTNEDNIHEANKATIRTIHQTVVKQI